MGKQFIFSFFMLLLFVQTKAQYIHEVIDYTPGPGQQMNAAPWGMPDSDNPATSIVGQLTGAMSLGAFGGYVVFRFENPVENHAENPYGIDFVVYGNPLKNMFPNEPNNAGWTEPGIVSVMKDENNNGVADDTWYELAGSDYYFSSTIKNYQVTYTNPNSEEAQDIAWSDNLGNNGFIFAVGQHTQSYYPLNENFPNINAESYTLSGTCIASNVDVSIPSIVKSPGRAWGYVDNTLRGSYDGLPDNPYTQNIQENSGGDAFDIDWAVDADGNYVDLDRVDFIKIHTGVLDNASWSGEVSTEITGAFDVAPNANIHGETKSIVLMPLPDTIKGTSHQIEAFAFDKGRINNNENIVWTTSHANATINDDMLLEFSQSGALTLYATLENNPHITDSISTHLIYEEEPTTYTLKDEKQIQLYPNPAHHEISILGLDKADIDIFNMSGKRIKTLTAFESHQKIDLSNLPIGIYFAKTHYNGSILSLRFVKN